MIQYRNVYLHRDGTQWLGRAMGRREDCDRTFPKMEYLALSRRIAVLRVRPKNLERYFN